MLKVMDLFSGIGGFSLGLERTGGFQTIAFCEIDPFCQKVLRKHWPDVPIYNDVRNLEHDGPVDVITGGYPCQPFSCAGKRKGANDDRHLWPAMFSLIKKYRPAWVIGENVAGHISMGLDNVLSDLGDANYGTRAFVIPACAVDARHRRDRVWIVGNSKITANRDERKNKRSACGKINSSYNTGGLGGGHDRPGYGKTFSNAKQRETDNERRDSQRGRDGVGWQGETTQQENRETNSDGPNGCGQNGGTMADPFIEQWDGRGNRPRWWRREPLEAIQDAGRGRRQEDGLSIPQSELGRVAYGLPDRVDRLASLGNAVVPQIPEMIGYAILEAMQ